MMLRYMKHFFPIIFLICLSVKGYCQYEDAEKGLSQDTTKDEFSYETQVTSLMASYYKSLRSSGIDINTQTRMLEAERKRLESNFHNELTVRARAQKFEITRLQLEAARRKLSSSIANTQDVKEFQSIPSTETDEQSTDAAHVLPDGGRYIGELEGTKPHGSGAMTLPDGSKYIGEFRDGKSHGHGTYIHSNGSKYIGEWQDGLMHGSGTFFFPKGHKYEKYVGEFRNHQLCGQGTISMPDGGKWEGEFRDNEMNGWGTMTYPSGGTDRVLYINSKYVRTAE